MHKAFSKNDIIAEVMTDLHNTAHVSADEIQQSSKDSSIFKITLGV